MKQADYIKREHMIDALRNHYAVNDATQNAVMDECVMLAMRVPAADVRENGNVDGQRDRWISVDDALPEPYTQVIVAWVNHSPAPYYMQIKDKPFVSTAVWFNGYWFWWNKRIEDLLKEYGERGGCPVDSAIEITHWMSLPKPQEDEDDG